MVAQRLFDELFALPLPDQVEVFDRLRQHLAAAADPGPLSDEVRQLLDTRLDAFAQDETAGSSWDDVARRITKRLAAR